MIFLFLPHVTGVGFWDRLRMMCLEKALTPYDGFAMCPQPLFTANMICG